MKEWIMARPDEATKDMLRDAFCTGELIRCKDCKYWWNQIDRCEMTGLVMYEDDYCSDAERKEE